MVRLGIGLYGAGSSVGIAPLEEVISWKCAVSQVSDLKPTILWVLELPSLPKGQ